MNTPITVGFLAVVGAVVFFVWYEPASRDGQALDVPKTEIVEAAPVARRPQAQPKRANIPPPVSPLTETPDPVVDAGPPEPDIGKGPWAVDLGKHTIHLKDDEGMVLHVQPRVWVTTPTTRKEVSRRRRMLVRMLYFLGSHRRAEGADGPDGQQRFQEDLLARFRNVVKSGPIARLELATYSVGLAPPPPEEGDEKD